MNCYDVATDHSMIGSFTFRDERLRVGMIIISWYLPLLRKIWKKGYEIVSSQCCPNKQGTKTMAKKSGGKMWSGKD